MVCLGGCTTIDVDPEFEYDPEAHDVFARNGSLEGEQTAAYVHLAARSGVDVYAVRVADTFDEQHNVPVQQWHVFAVNNRKYHRCLFAQWRLLDFALITDNQSNVLLQPQQVTTLGRMVGQVWEIDGVPVAPPPSGYVERLYVWNPDRTSSEEDQCLNVAQEDTILDIEIEWQ
jgi:hypothetical protein